MLDHLRQPTAAGHRAAFRNLESLPAGAGDNRDEERAAQIVETDHPHNGFISRLATGSQT